METNTTTNTGNTDSGLYGDLHEAKAGDITPTEVVSVERGKARDLMPDELLENSRYPVDLDSDIVKVVCANGAVDYFNVPKDGILKTKNKLARYKRTYGVLPARGAKVNTMIDENGFNRLLLHS